MRQPSLLEINWGIIQSMERLYGLDYEQGPKRNIMYRKTNQLLQSIFRAPKTQK